MTNKSSNFIRQSHHNKNKLNYHENNQQKTTTSHIFYFKTLSVFMYAHLMHLYFVFYYFAFNIKHISTDKEI